MINVFIRKQRATQREELEHLIEKEKEPCVFFHLY
jgi:hypothetical protein